MARKKISGPDLVRKPDVRSGHARTGPFSGIFHVFGDISGYSWNFDTRPIANESLDHSLSI